MTSAKNSALMPNLRFPEFRDTGEWDSTNFGAIATFINGRAYKQEELLDQGKYRVLRVGNFFTNKEWYFSDLELEDDKYCDGGDLLYAWSASFGPRIWTDEKVIYHYHIWKVVEAKGIDRKFLFFLLGYETERMKAKSANGLGLLHITKSAVERWECCIPKQEAEQRKIANCLTSIDELINLEAKKLSMLKTHKRGLMQKLFPADGETLPKIRFPQFRDAGEWDERTLDQISGAIFDGTHQTPTYAQDGIPFFSVENIVSGKANKFIHRDDYLSATSKNRPEKGDVLITRIGKIGFSAVVDWDYEFSVYVTLAVVKKAACFDSRYLHTFFQSDRYQNEILSRSLLNAAPCKINMNELRKTKILLPCLSEQKKIADCLSSFDDQINNQTEKVEALKIHKKGLMQQLSPILHEVEM